MCELHLHKCTSCGARWQSHRKLPSCETSDPTLRCPKRLCMYVGIPENPRSSECQVCAFVREALDEFGYDDASILTGDGGQCAASNTSQPIFLMRSRIAARQVGAGDTSDGQWIKSGDYTGCD
ncbi:uncharacterized protein CTRU02_206046 [Colletotrichum truncatum]|uniref:Uncharacterized protein n=1 Tax=Colletotrichum truncatum TaxID=5467 RepID=A0ACC3Z5R1_COLTU|nr:uncharacterized protein CTRU02_10542 [Colletotrichum truncatum]KAF6787278.1 hypothetical protein CTRU02_10542 [Colletotrichum truncatum]